MRTAMVPDGVIGVDHGQDGVTWIELRWTGSGHLYSVDALKAIAKSLRTICAQEPNVVVISPTAASCLPGHEHCVDATAIDRRAWFHAGVAPLLSAVQEAEQVTISALTGEVTGMELLVSLACDARIASTAATIGMDSAFPGTASLVRQIAGRAGLAAAIVGHGGGSVDHALRGLLVNEVLSDDGFRDRVRELAGEVGRRGGRGALTAKRLLRLPADLELSEVLEFELNLPAGAPAGASPEARGRPREGVAGAAD